MIVSSGECPITEMARLVGDSDIRLSNYFICSQFDLPPPPYMVCVFFCCFFFLIKKILLGKTLQVVLIVRLNIFFKYCPFCAFII